MIVLVLVLTGGLYTLASVGSGKAVPATGIIPFLVLVFVLMLVAHLSLRRLAPQADPVLLPLAALLNGMGYVFIAGLDKAQASAQATWTAVGVIAFVATLALFPRAIDLERYRYIIALVGVALLLLPLVPHIGEDVNGARLWVRAGPLSFQPEEFAKLALAIFFASVLAERADLLATGTRRIGRWLVLEPRYLAPLIAAWGVSLLVLLAENDLGSSFLFFALFLHRARSPSPSAPAPSSPSTSFTMPRRESRPGCTHGHISRPRVIRSSRVGLPWRAGECGAWGRARAIRASSLRPPPTSYLRRSGKRSGWWGLLRSLSPTCS